MATRRPRIRERADPVVLWCCQCRQARNLPRQVREEKDVGKNTADVISGQLREWKVTCGGCSHKPCGTCKLLDVRKQDIKTLAGENLLLDRFNVYGWRCHYEQCLHINPIDTEKTEFDDLDMMCHAETHNPQKPTWFTPFSAVVNGYNEDLGLLKTDRLKLREGPLKEHLRRYARAEGKKRVEDDQGTPAVPQAFGYSADGDYMVALRFISQSLRDFVKKMDRAWKAYLKWQVSEAAKAPIKPTERSYYSVRPFETNSPGDGRSKTPATQAAAKPRPRHQSHHGDHSTPSSGSVSGSTISARSSQFQTFQGPFMPTAGYVEDEDGMYDNDLDEGEGEGHVDAQGERDAESEPISNYHTPLTMYSSGGSTYQTAGPTSAAYTPSGGYASSYSPSGGYSSGYSPAGVARSHSSTHSHGHGHAHGGTQQGGHGQQYRLEPHPQPAVYVPETPEAVMTDIDDEEWQQQQHQLQQEREWELQDMQQFPPTQHHQHHHHHHHQQHQQQQQFQYHNQQQHPPQQQHLHPGPHHYEGQQGFDAFGHPTPQWGLESARSPNEVLQNYYDASAMTPHPDGSNGGGGGYGGKSGRESKSGRKGSEGPKKDDKKKKKYGKK